MGLHMTGSTVTQLNNAYGRKATRDLREWGTITAGSDHTSLLTAAIADLDGTPDTFGDVDELVLPRLGFSINLGAVTFTKGIRLTAKEHVTLAGTLTFNAGDVEINGLRLLADPSLAVGRPISVLGAAAGGSCTSFKWKGGGGRLLPGLIATSAVPVVELDGLDVTMPADPTKGVTAATIDDVDTYVTVKNTRLVGPVVGVIPSNSLIGWTFRGSYNITFDNNDVTNFYTNVAARESPTLANTDRQCKSMVATRNRLHGARKTLLIDGVTRDQSQGFYIMSLDGGQFTDNVVDDFEQTAYAFSYQSASVPSGWSAWPACRNVLATANRAHGAATAATPSWGYLLNHAHDCIVSDNHVDGPVVYGVQNTAGTNNRVVRNHIVISRSDGVRGVYTGEGETNSVVEHNTGTVTDSGGGSTARAVQLLTNAPGTFVGRNYITVGGTGPTFYTDNTQTAGGWSTSQSQGRVVSKSANYTTTRDDSVVLVTGTRTITLLAPDAAGAGRLVTIKNVGTGTVTVSASGGSTIDGASTHVISAQYDSRDLVSDGTNWSVI